MAKKFSATELGFKNVESETIFGGNTKEKVPKFSEIF